MRRNITPDEYFAFRQAVLELRPYVCWGCELAPHETVKCQARSAGRVDAHHLIAQQLLRRELAATPDHLYDALRDARNGVPVRRWHHMQLEARMLRPTLADLPTDTASFAFAYGLEWALERAYGHAEAA